MHMVPPATLGRASFGIRICTATAPAGTRALIECLNAAAGQSSACTGPVPDLRHGVLADDPARLALVQEVPGPVPRAWHAKPLPGWRRQ